MYSEMVVIRVCYWYFSTIAMFITLTVYIKVFSGKISTIPRYGVNIKTIYVWDRPEWLFMKMGPTVEDFETLGCQVSACRLVDRTSYTQQVYEADSVLFTIRDFYVNPPRRQNQDQIWVLWLREAPLHYFPTDLDTLNDLFNLTFTYLNDSDTDIHSPVGKIVPRPRTGSYHPRDVQFVKEKTKAVAWVVSNCESRGQRSQYVTELSRYIGVDVYGDCGYNCSRKGQYCMRMIENYYHFYLAFESMYCRDYVTEKMYRTLSYDVIPVVLGGADYANTFRPRSYIDIRDFSSPKHLAAYLKRLMRKHKEYLSYFDWKNTHMAIPYCTESLCDLCKVLHTPDYKYKSGFAIDKYWNPDEQCLYGHREREALHL